MTRTAARPSTVPQVDADLAAMSYRLKLAHERLDFDSVTTLTRSINALLDIRTELTKEDPE